MKLNFTTTGVKIAFSLFVLSGSFSAANAQNVGINDNGAAPNASAMLDISSTTKGLLIPNVALTATNSAGPISSPATSLMVYNTATAGTAPYNVTPGFYYYNGSAWVAVSGPGTSISGTTNYVSKFTGTNTIGNSQIIDNGTNVVIGTITTPSAKLNVEADGTGNLLMLAQRNLSTPGVPTPRLTADINGNLTISGKFNSLGIQETSDIRFKKDIAPLAPVLGKVLQIEGVTYNWRREDFPDRAFGERTEIGFIAQELEKVFPELVNTDKEGYKSVQYSHMVPVLLEAIKEQQALMAGMQQQIGTLSAAMENANAAFEARLQQELQTIRQQLQNSSNTRSITDADHR